MSQRYEGPLADGPYAGQRFASIWTAFRIDATDPANPKNYELMYVWDDKGQCWRLGDVSAALWESVRHEFEEEPQ